MNDLFPFEFLYLNDREIPLLKIEKNIFTYSDIANIADYLSKFPAFSDNDIFPHQLN